MSTPATIQTVTGPIRSDELGRTLMHEHLAIGYPGWEAATDEPFDRAEAVEVCIEQVERLQQLGYSSLVDPCPNDLGRDVELMVGVAEATGFNIICATGLYKEHEGGHAHWDFRARFEDIGAVMTDLFVSELTDGIGTTGVRPGLIKVGTGLDDLTTHESAVYPSRPIRRTARWATVSRRCSPRQESPPTASSSATPAGRPTPTTTSASPGAAAISASIDSASPP